MHDWCATTPIRTIGDYRVWPGSNSNTFVAAIIAAVPGMRAALRLTALGKDFTFDRRWVGCAPSHTGIRLTLWDILKRQCQIRSGSSRSQPKPTQKADACRRCRIYFGGNVTGGGAEYAGEGGGA
jgi:hypothetical protein